MFRCEQETVAEKGDPPAHARKIKAHPRVCGENFAVLSASPRRKEAHPAHAGKIVKRC